MTGPGDKAASALSRDVATGRGSTKAVTFGFALICRDAAARHGAGLSLQERRVFSLLCMHIDDGVLVCLRPRCHCVVLVIRFMRCGNSVANAGDFCTTSQTTQTTERGSKNRNEKIMKQKKSKRTKQKEILKKMMKKKCKQGHRRNMTTFVCCAIYVIRPDLYLPGYPCGFLPAGNISDQSSDEKRRCCCSFCCFFSLFFCFLGPLPTLCIVVPAHLCPLCFFISIWFSLFPPVAVRLSRIFRSGCALSPSCG